MSKVNSDSDGLDRRQFLIAGGGSLAAISMSGLLAACGGDSGGGGTGGSGGGGGSGRTLTIGISSDPTTLDPEFGSNVRANETIKNLYAGWTKYATKPGPDGILLADREADLEGEALESFSFSADGKTVAMKVREGVQLPSGNPLNADTFVFKVQRNLGVAGPAVFNFNALGVTEPSQARKLSENELELQLPGPNPFVAQMLRDQDSGIVDAALVKENTTAKDEWATEWVGRNGAPTGAYLIRENQPGTRLVLEANPDYWEEPYFTTVILQIIPSSEQRVQLLKQGDLDIAQDLSSDDVLSLEEADGIKIVNVPSLSQNFFGFNCEKPPFDDVRVRQAAAYAIPYEALAKDALNGYALVPKGVYPQNSVWFQSDIPYPYQTDPEKAKSLLSEAGVTDVSFDLEFNEGDGDAETLAVPVQTALREVGITVNLKKLPAATFQEHLNDRSMQAFIMTNVAAYVDDPLYFSRLFLYSEAIINWFNYKNAEIDAAVEALAETLDKDERMKQARTIQTRINEDVPYVSLGDPNYVLPLREDINGVLVEPDPLLTYRHLKRD